MLTTILTCLAFLGAPAYQTDVNVAVVLSKVPQRLYTEGVRHFHNVQWDVFPTDREGVCAIYVVNWGEPIAVVRREVLGKEKAVRACLEEFLDRYVHPNTDSVLWAIREASRPL